MNDCLNPGVQIPIFIHGNAIECTTYLLINYENVTCKLHSPFYSPKQVSSYQIALKVCQCMGPKQVITTSGDEFKHNIGSFLALSGTPCAGRLLNLIQFGYDAMTSNSSVMIMVYSDLCSLVDW